MMRDGADVSSWVPSTRLSSICGALNCCCGCLYRPRGGGATEVLDPLCHRHNIFRPDWTNLAARPVLGGLRRGVRRARRSAGTANVGEVLSVMRRSNANADAEANVRFADPPAMRRLNRLRHNRRMTTAFERAIIADEKPMQIHAQRSGDQFTVCEHYGTLLPSPRFTCGEPTNCPRCEQKVCHQA